MRDMRNTRSKSNGRDSGRTQEQAPLIAIVDDDASVRQSTDRLIRSFGYRTQVLGAGQDFLNSAAAGHAACLLLDVRMPGMDGLEVQRRLAGVRFAYSDPVRHGPGQRRGGALRPFRGLSGVPPQARRPGEPAPGHRERDPGARSRRSWQWRIVRWRGTQQIILHPTVSAAGSW